MIVTIEFDTETKQVVVKEDGAVMPDVESVSIYKNCYRYEDENKDTFDLYIGQCGKKQNGVTKRISTMAKVFGYKDEN